MKPTAQDFTKFVEIFIGCDFWSTIFSRMRHGKFLLNILIGNFIFFVWLVSFGRNEMWESRLDAKHYRADVSLITALIAGSLIEESGEHTGCAYIPFTEGWQSVVCSCGFARRAKECCEAMPPPCLMPWTEFPARFRSGGGEAAFGPPSFPAWADLDGYRALRWPKRQRRSQLVNGTRQMRARFEMVRLPGKVDFAVKLT
jgi:hypothetical protein